MVPLPYMKVRCTAWALPQDKGSDTEATQLRREHMDQPALPTPPATCCPAAASECCPISSSPPCSAAAAVRSPSEGPSLSQPRPLRLCFAASSAPERLSLGCGPALSSGRMPSPPAQCQWVGEGQSCSRTNRNAVHSKT